MVTYSGQLVYLLMILGYSFLILFFLLEDSSKQFTLLLFTPMSHFHIRFQGVEKWNTGVKRVNIHSILVGVFEEKNHKNTKKRELFIIFLKRALSCHATMPSYHSHSRVSEFSRCYTITQIAKSSSLHSTVLTLNSTITWLIESF